jgi:hypothetical protein
MFQRIVALFTAQNVNQEWNGLYGAHCHWKDDVYNKFNAKNIHEILNVEPAIDHDDYYNATIPDYFKEDTTTLNWIDQNFDKLPGDLQYDAKKIVCESAAIFAAHSMCHPRDRVGKFDWSDVLSLHECLKTPYLGFIKKHNLFSVQFQSI